MKQWLSELPAKTRGVDLPFPRHCCRVSHTTTCRWSDAGPSSHPKTKADLKLIEVNGPRLSGKDLVFITPRISLAWRSSKIKYLTLWFWGLTLGKMPWDCQQKMHQAHTCVQDAWGLI